MKHTTLSSDRTPRHVAVVMDGNGRWAAARGLPRSDGHAAGARRVLEATDVALEIGLQELSVFAFSTENWRRSPEEVAALLNVIAEMMRNEGPKLLGKGVCLRWVGRPLGGWPDLARELDTIQQLTASNTALRLNVCVN
jgi:undecaprenyl diphosphate synthase